MIRNIYRRASPGFWPTAGALLALYIAPVAFSAWPAQGQEPETTSRIAARLSMGGVNRCVGYQVQPGAQACWTFGCFPMDLSARPFGPSGWGTMNPQVFGERYTGDQGYLGCCPQGAGAELLEQATIPALQNSWNGLCSEISLTRTGCNGTPTAEEVWDFALTTPRCSAAYLNCWWRHNQGRNPADPHRITTPDHWKARTWVLENARVCAPGLYEVREGIYCGTPGKWGTGWPTYYQVEAGAIPADVPWCTGAPPPPHPTPVPPPIPQPPGPPECEPLEGSRFLRSCRNRTPPLEAAECRELAARNPNSTLASLLARVCPEPEPPPPPPPPPPPVETCQPGGWECTWEGGRKYLLPGAPSTAVLTVEVACRACPEVEP